jgi:hypothetical protein
MMAARSALAFPPAKSERKRGAYVRLPKSFEDSAVNGLIYLVGLVVVILAILSFFGMH